MFTVGHSTRELPAFLELLRRSGVAVLADVRRVPRSRRVPQFNREALARACEGDGIAYVHLPELGGWRRPEPDSPNRGWRVEAFRGYADHMATPEFAAGLARLIEIAERAPTACMCAEAQWTRCHRRLLSDALLVRGCRVLHLGGGEPEEHALTPFAVVEGDSVTYPPGRGTRDALL